MILHSGSIVLNPLSFLSIVVSVYYLQGPVDLLGTVGQSPEDVAAELGRSAGEEAHLIGGLNKAS